MDGKKTSRGGRRQGAGRPKAYSKLYTFRAPKELVPIIEAQQSKSDFFKECIGRALAGSAVAGAGTSAGSAVAAGAGTSAATGSDVAAGVKPLLKEDQELQLGGLSQELQLGGLSQELQLGGLSQELQLNKLGQELQLGGLSQELQLNKLSQESQLGKLGQVVPAERVRPLSLPFFDIGIVAGFPVPLDNDEKGQDIELLRMLCPNPESSYLIRVEGDSMIDAGIFSGDIVIVDKSNRSPAESQVAVCEFNGEYTLKRFVRRDGAGWLVPANPDYPEIKVTQDDSFSIWGTVTYIIHKPRG